MRGPKQLVVIAVFAAAARAPAQGLSGTCTILNAAGRATLDGDVLEVGNPIGQHAIVSLLPGPGPLVIHLSAEDNVHAVVYIDSESTVEFGAPAGPARAITIRRGGAAWVHYTATDGVPLTIVTEAGGVHLHDGTLRVVAAADRSIFLLAEGKGSAFAGDPPPPADGTTLDPGPGGQNQAEVTRSPPQVETAERPNALRQMRDSIDRAHAVALRAARARWLLLAVAGDIEPSVKVGEPVDAVVGALAATSSVTQPTVAAVITASPATTSAFGAPTVTSRAQTLLKSGNAASVIVGARLQRTRIVGNPGTAGGRTGVRFNPDVRAPLRLSSTSQRR